MFDQNINTHEDLFNSNPFFISWTFLKAHSKAKFRSNSDDGDDDDDYYEYVDGMRLCLSTTATNGPVGHLPGDT
jgi:hypothetical protein